MDLTPKHSQSAFFALNVWEEKLDGGYVEWRGELLDVDGNLALHFTDWPELVDFIADALYALRPDDREQKVENLTGN